MEASDLGADPIAAFRQWLAEAKADAKMRNPNAMALATTDTNGQPSVRMVLLKDVSEHGFIFYTNYGSRKAQELASERAALCFYWDAMGRQVRVQGAVEKVSRETSEKYFHTRPRGSQCGAWASRQSQPLASRAELEKAFADVEERFSGEEIPLPPHWGGYLVRPQVIEFWHECPSRLHDRIVFTRDLHGWVACRLFP